MLRTVSRARNHVHMHGRIDARAYSMRSRKCSLPGMLRMASQYMADETAVITHTTRNSSVGTSQPDLGCGTWAVGCAGEGR